MEYTLFSQRKDFERHGRNARSIWSLRSIELLKVCPRDFGGLIQGTAIAHEELFNLIQLSAQQPDMAPLFNYASSAWNNAFFFSGIVIQLIFGYTDS